MTTDGIEISGPYGYITHCDLETFLAVLSAAEEHGWEVPRLEYVPIRTDYSESGARYVTARLSPTEAASLVRACRRALREPRLHRQVKRVIEDLVHLAAGPNNWIIIEEHHQVAEGWTE